MFFERRDIIAVHTLAAASQGILIDLGKSRKISSILIDSEFILPEKRDEVNRKIREAQNYFKHADRDAEAQFNYCPDTTPLFLFDACLLYNQIAGYQFTEARCFCTWLFMKYPQLLVECELKDNLRNLLGNIDINDFEFILNAIDKMNNNPEAKM